MKEVCIVPDEIIKYMGMYNYSKFIEEIQEKYLDKSKGFWLVIKQLEKSDISKGDK